MSSPNLPLDLTPLSAPAVKLIDAVSNAIGVVYEPTRIRRKAKADADAALTLAKSREAISNIEFRASERLRNKELRRQENIESITAKALNALPNEVSNNPVEADWIYRFFEACEDVSNDEMQVLWGKLLAGEVSKPGSFSTRTIRIVRDLSRVEANSFSSLCGFLWDFIPNQSYPVVLEIDSLLMKNQGLNFSKLLDLASLGLLEVQTSSSTEFSLNDVKGSLLGSYFGKQYFVVPLLGQTSLTLGKVMLTSVGRELAPIAGGKANEEIENSVISAWSRAGFQVTAIPPLA